MSDTDQYKGKYRIQSTRLKEWDYSSFGYYFVTIGTINRKCLFGKIEDGKMELSKIGEMVREYWLEIPQQFQNIKLDEFIIMPNHLRGILIIGDQNRRDAINRVSTHRGGITQAHNPMLSENSLSRIIRWYKGKCRHEINRLLKTTFSWQPRFYDHVIQSEESLLQIREYIRDNPLKWDVDEENPAVFLKNDNNTQRRTGR